MSNKTRELKRKMKSVDSTMQITNAMQLVSSAKLQRATKRMNITKPYFETVKEAIQDILSEDKSIKNKFVHENEIKKTVYIVVSSDKGLCGGYNINLYKKVLSEVGDLANAKFIVVGRKIDDQLKKINAEIIDSYLNISESPEYSDASAIAKTALQMYMSGEVDAVKLIYTKYVSALVQEPTTLTLLPIQRVESDLEDNSDDDYQYVNYEPSPEEVLNYIIPKYVESTLFGGLIESSTGEQAARRIAMENATDNAKEIIDDLSLSYNRARQASITGEIIEIVAGAEALK